MGCLYWAKQTCCQRSQELRLCNLIIGYPAQMGLYFIEYFASKEACFARLGVNHGYHF